MQFVFELCNRALGSTCRPDSSLSSRSWSYTEQETFMLVANGERDLLELIPLNHA